MNLSRLLNREERIDFSAIAEFDHKVVALQAENMRLRKKLEATYVVASGEAVNWKGVGTKIKNFFGNIWAHIVKFFKWIWSTLKKWGRNILRYCGKIKNWFLNLIRKKKKKEKDPGSSTFASINVEALNKLLGGILQEFKENRNKISTNSTIKNIFSQNGKIVIPNKTDIEKFFNEMNSDLTNVENIISKDDHYERLQKLCDETIDVPLSRLDTYNNEMIQSLTKLEELVTELESLLDDVLSEQQTKELEKVNTLVENFKEGSNEHTQMNEIIKYTEEINKKYNITGKISKLQSDLQKRVGVVNDVTKAIIATAEELSGKIVDLFTEQMGDQLEDLFKDIKSSL